MKKLAMLVLASFALCGMSYADEQQPSSAATATATAAAAPEPAATPDARDTYYPSGFYLGLNLGMAQAQMDSVPTYQTKNSGFGGRTYFGYDFNRYFSFDAGYVFFPTVKYTNSEFPTLNITNNAFDGLFTGKFPLGEGFSIYGQLGGAWLTANMSGDNITGQKATATVLAYGSGLDYVFSNFGGGGLHMVLDWYHTDNKNGSPFNIPAENLYTLGTYYQF